MVKSGGRVEFLDVPPGVELTDETMSISINADAVLPDGSLPTELIETFGKRLEFRKAFCDGPIGTTGLRQLGGAE